MIKSIQCVIRDHSVLPSPTCDWNNLSVFLYIQVSFLLQSIVVLRWWFTASRLKNPALVNDNLSSIHLQVEVMSVNPKWTGFLLTQEAVTQCFKAKIHMPTNNPEDYVLKGNGSEYVVGNYELCDYKVF